MRRARSDDTAAANLLKTYEKLARENPGPTRIDEVRRDQLLASQERRVELDEREEQVLRKTLEHCYARSERSKAITRREERDTWKALEQKARETKSLPSPEAQAKADEVISRLKGLTALITGDPKAIVEAALAGDATPPQTAAPIEASSIQPEGPDGAAASPGTSDTPANAD